MATRFSFGSRGAESTAPQVYETARRNGAPVVQGIGAALRERREAMGVTLAEAEVATRIRQKYLAALEADEWQLLPGEVVGRGFLRNYATYLGLEPTEIIEHRRAVVDPSLASSLATISAGSNLPPTRQVDYRPKEVDLRDEPDVMETRELRLGPLLATLAVAAFAVLLWFGRDPIGNAATDAVDAIEASMAGLTTRPAAPTATLVATTDAAAVVNPQNLGGQADPQAPVAGTDESIALAGSTELEPETAEQAAQPPASNDGGEGAGGDTPAGGGLSALAALRPTATPEPVDATATAEAFAAVEPTPTPAPPEPTAIPTEAPTPTEEPTPEPVVLPPLCPDERSVITSPGVSQVVNGTVGVTGTAVHEAFSYYKLEFAPGADAGGGYVYFDGAQSPVAGGLLGNLDTTALANGDYTIQLIVVDQSGNFPAPCRVTISVQN